MFTNYVYACAAERMRQSRIKYRDMVVTFSNLMYCSCIFCEFHPKESIVARQRTDHPLISSSSLSIDNLIASPLS